MVNDEGNTPLYDALYDADTNEGSLEDVERVLLKSATVAEVNHIIRDGKTVLSFAISTRNCAMIGLLARYGASLDLILANGSLC